MSPAVIPGARKTEVPKSEWETPAAMRNAMRAEFRLRLDVAATASNALTGRYYDQAANGLAQPWECESGGWWWCNPPYNDIGPWVAKAASEHQQQHPGVLLIPANTDTRYWHAHIWDGRTNRPRTGIEVRFLAGRIKFEYQGKPVGSSTFASALVVFHA